MKSYQWWRDGSLPGWRVTLDGSHVDHVREAYPEEGRVVVLCTACAAFPHADEGGLELCEAELRGEVMIHPPEPTT